MHNNCVEKSWLAPLFPAASVSLSGFINSVQTGAGRGESSLKERSRNLHTGGSFVDHFYVHNGPEIECR